MLNTGDKFRRPHEYREYEDCLAHSLTWQSLLHVIEAIANKTYKSLVPRSSHRNAVQEVTSK